MLIARSERRLQDGHEAAASSPLATKKISTVREYSELDDAVDYPCNNGADQPHTSDSNSAACRFLDTSAIDPRVVGNNLWLFIWLKTIGSFDSGAFSAALGAESGIGNSWELSMKHQGILTSSVFLGNVIGCPLSGYFFSRYNEKRVLCGALVVHTVFTFLFAAVPHYTIALINRFFIGFTLSFIVVYTPVWIDEFAPKNRQSVWMASHNAGVPLGIMLGYILAVGPQMVVDSVDWNWAFFLKCLLMIPTITYVAQVDSRTINTARTAADNDKDDNDADTAEESGGNNDARGECGRPSNAATSANPPVAAAPASMRNSLRDQASRALRTPIGDIPASIMAHLRYAVSGFQFFCVPLLCNVVYICSVISLTSLYFVATGLQNFVTQYLQEPPFEASMATIMVGFGSAVVTAPVCGVIAGGILLDLIGGYKRNLPRVTLFLLTWGGLAVLFSIVCIFAKTTCGFLLVMSVVLFCGGALIPPGAGLTMAHLPDHLRPTGAALSQTVYNLLGNFSGPLVCGWVADATGKLRYGIITLLLSSTLGVLPLFGILFVAFRGGASLNGLGGGSPDEVKGARDEEVAAENVVMGDTYEMASVCGEAAVEDWGGRHLKIGSPPPQREHSRSQEATSELPTSPYLRHLATANGVNGALEAAAVSKAGPSPPPSPSQRPFPSHTAPFASVGSAPLPVPRLQQQQPLLSPLSGILRYWGTRRPSLHGPGTAHLVVAPLTTAGTPAAHDGAEVGAAADTDVAPRRPLQKQATRVTDVELLRLESDGAQVISVPNERSYGMDLVRSWLWTQQTPQHLTDVERANAPEK
ncbi:hypothetical protein ABL78_1466 [Leptomonas seymouri]|uniref:Major facilitator superfamily (MFS) profile domain-containing protein n=1 Tax=Leptomonas seymouri TaxID=5684 RepID=A0A0N1IAL7_LEPSE|nr:hypothetical protein ABL78_1466 [Leptomonas seymouri]|eukprot:KPI89430.1 hypothetical protein ABL78_1466 [Leptomonas seymouri]